MMCISVFICVCDACVYGSSLLPICLWNVCVRDFVPDTSPWCLRGSLSVACVSVDLGLYFVCGMRGSL